MEEIIFKHMYTVRGITENSIRKIPEEFADIIPEGFKNSIRWNFGHIAYVQERLVFGLCGETMNTPTAYEEFFKAGTSPSEWKITPPTLSAIAEVLSTQKDRIPEFIKNNFNKELVKPFTNSGGLTFHTVGETFLFSLYHEAMHIQTIKMIYRAIKSQA